MLRFGQFATAAALAVSLAAPAAAAEYRDFDEASFAAAQAQGRPILIDVAAWWCPICASQHRTIDRIVADPAYDPLIVYHVSYDHQTAVWKGFGVNKQGTLIGFGLGHEVGRLAFVTDKDQISALLAAIVQR
jgi:thioredoxin-like negative regulator of GroEL